jgi:hypothetical protein
MAYALEARRRTVACKDRQTQLLVHIFFCHSKDAAIIRPSRTMADASASAADAEQVESNLPVELMRLTMTDPQAIALLVRDPRAPAAVVASCLVVNRSSNEVARLDATPGQSQQQRLPFCYNHHGGLRGPTAVAVARSGRFALVANNSGASIGRVDLVTQEITFPFQNFRYARRCGMALEPPPDATSIRTRLQPGHCR